MVPQEVIAYVQRLRANGYAAQAIRQNLLASGYTSQEAEQALAAAFRPVSSASSRNWVPLAAGGGAGAVVLVVLLLIFLPSSPAFTVTTRPNTVEARAGTTLTFADTFEFKSKLKSSEIALTHELVAPATGNLLFSHDENVPAGASATSKVDLPDDLQPGRYLLKTIAKGDGHTAETSFSFKVLPALPKTSAPNTPAPVIPITPTPGVPASNESTAPTQASCNDFDPCTEDTVVDGKCAFNQLPVCCGDYICKSDLGETTATCPRDCAAQPDAKSTSDIVAEAEQTATKDGPRAQLLCGTLAQQSDADQCYDSVARISATSAGCLKITDGKTKDSCLLYFAINKDEFSVCYSIGDPNLQSSCFSFRNLHEIQSSQPSA
jgi:methionine-rich copper-binding protein CopC